MDKTINNLFTAQKSYYNTGSTRNPDFRRQALLKLKQSIIKNELLIVEALKKDLGKPKMEAYTAEIGNVIKEINFLHKNLKKWIRPAKVNGTLLDFPSKGYKTREPFGNVLIIGPWNYPFELTLSPLAGAIAAGNTTIVKPSEISTESSRVIHKIISEAFNEEYIAVVEGGRDVVEYLQENPFDKIFFTGSPSVGKIIMQKAALHLTPVTLELGGKSPCIIDKNINIDTAVKRILWGKFMNNGQTCISPDYLIIHKSGREKFLESMQKNIISFWGTNIKDNPDYGRIINQRHFNRVSSLFSSDEVLIGGKMDEKTLFIEPTIIEVNDLNHPIMKEEIFGPVLPLITYTNIDIIIDIVSRNPSPLALYIFSEDKKFVKSLISTIPSGGVCINDTISHMLNHRIPFGGKGRSGMGNYHGKYSIDTFSHHRAVLKKSMKIDIPVKYPPYKNNHELIRKYMLK
jgi:aldehyde dehydrogenase (NAD+)